LLAVGILVAIWFVGVLMFLRGGSQRSRFEIQQKVNPAQVLDWRFKKAVAHSLKRREKREKKFGERLERIEERLKRLERS